MYHRTLEKSREQVLLDGVLDNERRACTLTYMWFEFDSVHGQFLLSHMFEHSRSRLWWQVVERHTVIRFIASAIRIVSCTEFAAIPP